MSRYIRGKAKAERALTELYSKNGVSIRPTMIYGMRRVKNIPLPLGVVGAPLALLNSQLSMLRHVPLVGGFFLPPVNVDVREKERERRKSNVVHHRLLLKLH